MVEMMHTAEREGVINNMVVPNQVSPGNATVISYEATNSAALIFSIISITGRLKDLAESLMAAGTQSYKTVM